MFFIPNLKYRVLKAVGGIGFVKKSTASREEDIGSSFDKHTIDFFLL